MVVVLLRGCVCEFLLFVGGRCGVWSGVGCVFFVHEMVCGGGVCVCFDHVILFCRRVCVWLLVHILRC